MTRSPLARCKDRGGQMRSNSYSIPSKLALRWIGVPMYQPIVSDIASGRSNRKGRGSSGLGGASSGSGAGSRLAVLSASDASRDKPTQSAGNSHQEFSTESAGVMAFFASRGRPGQD